MSLRKYITNSISNRIYAHNRKAFVYIPIISNWNSCICNIIFIKNHKCLKYDCKKHETININGWDICAIHEDLVNPQIELFTFNLICKDCTQQGYVLDQKITSETIHIKNTLTGIKEEPYIIVKMIDYH